MTPEHAEVVERLLDSSDITVNESADDAVAAIRALAGEIERLKGEVDAIRPHPCPGYVAIRLTTVQALEAERDTLRVTVAEQAATIEALKLACRV